LLKLGVFPTLVILSFFVSILMIFIYKLMTNQTEMKLLKEDIKKNQKEMRSLRKEPEKMMAVQKKVTKLNMKYMKETFKPTLVTFIPIIIIFAWMNANLAFEPINPAADFVVDVFVDKNLQGNVSVDVPAGLVVVEDLSKSVVNDKASFTFRGDKGEYWIDFSFLDDSVQKKVIISDEQKYVQPVENFKDSKIVKVAVLQNKLKVFLGLTWLWTYIIFAVILNMLLRKLLKVY
jgi:uncharacterized membrane protein (DUF106 family)